MNYRIYRNNQKIRKIQNTRNNQSNRNTLKTQNLQITGVVRHILSTSVNVAFMHFFD